MAEHQHYDSKPLVLLNGRWPTWWFGFGIGFGFGSTRFGSVPSMNQFQKTKNYRNKACQKHNSTLRFGCVRFPYVFLAKQANRKVGDFEIRIYYIFYFRMSNFTIWLFLLVKREENTQNRIVKLKLVYDRPTTPPKHELPLICTRGSNKKASRGWNKKSHSPSWGGDRPLKATIRYAS